VVEKRLLINNISALFIHFPLFGGGAGLEENGVDLTDPLEILSVPHCSLGSHANSAGTYNKELYLRTQNNGCFHTYFILLKLSLWVCF
jgi:hypothetical protein